MGFAKEFKEFALKGNVVDLAVGVIIGAAFKTIVDSVVNDLIMPVVGIFLKSDFTNLYLPLSEKGIQAKDANPAMTLAEAKTVGPVFAWGSFATSAFNFLILAFIIFFMVKAINKMKLKQQAPPPPAGPSSTDKLLMEIRDSLKK